LDAARPLDRGANSSRCVGPLTEAGALRGQGPRTGGSGEPRRGAVCPQDTPRPEEFGARGVPPL
jgi:hypothetical protein